MHILIITCIILTLGYTVLMFIYGRGWAKQPVFVIPVGYEPHTMVSIIIPARNEDANIGACIESILAQKYPAHLFNVIVIDDHSTDNTAAIVEEYADRNVRCIKLVDYIDANEKITAYKKRALSIAIAQAKGELIITTDADCTAPNAWLLHIAAKYEQEHPVMIVAPVVFSRGGSALNMFQSIDFISMQGITAAAQQLKLGNMSNGANLAFSRSAYESVNGYEGIDNLASGDDYLLMMKLNKEYPNRIAYLRSENAIVTTAPQLTWSSFLQQRIRWASKSGKYNDSKLTGILLLVYLFNFSFLVLCIGGFFKPVLFCVAAAMFLVKVIVELIFLIPVATFFRRTRMLRYFPFLQPLHIAYIILAGFLGFVGVYQWKGRRVK